MPIRPFKQLPRNLVEWATFFRSTEVSPDAGTVGTEQLEDLAVTAPKLGDGAVTNDKLRDSAALSVIGRAGGTAGEPADIAAGSDGVYLRRSSGALGFGVIAESDIPAAIARDSEVTAAITAHEGASDPHPGYTTAAELTTALSALNLASGVYTPTVTGVTNVDAVTGYECQYLRVGATVTVSGRVDVDATAAASTQVRISVPIASNFGASSDCAGAAAATAIAMSAGIFGDTGNDAAMMEYIAADTANRALWFTFSYQVI